jgi:hypothetical protein
LQKLLICQDYNIADLQYLKKVYNKSGDEFEYYKQSWKHKSKDIVPIFYIFPACSYIAIKGDKEDLSKLYKEVYKEIIQLEKRASNVFEAYLKYCKDNRLQPKNNSAFFRIE